MSDGDAFSYASESPPPGALFVDDGKSLLVFPSVAAAERALDPSEVESGCYLAAYGPQGEPFAIRCEGRSVSFAPTGEDARPEELKHLLLRYCEDCEDPDDATTSLDALAAHAWTLERNFQLRNPEAVRRARFPAWGCVVVAIAAAAIAYLVLRWSGLWPLR
jgi:hypothetical protein